MNIQRLKVLLAFLKTVPAEKFDLQNWRKINRDVFSKDKYSEASVTDDELKHDCGTTACAIGWACSIPEFQDEGLSYHPIYGPDFDGVESWDAVYLFFELTHEQAGHLFLSSSYRYGGSLNAVIARLEAFINVHSKT